MNKLIVIMVSIISSLNLFITGEISAANGNSGEGIISTTDTSICLQIKNHFLLIDFVSPSVFRLRMNNENNFPEGGMVKYGIVNTKCQDHRVRVSENENFAEIKTDSVILNIDKNDGAIKLLDNEGNIILRNDQPPISSLKKGFELSFHLEEDERLYGFGDVSRDQIQRRGLKTEVLVTNRTGYIPIPFVMSDRNWGLFMNTTMYHSFDAGAEIRDRLSFTSTRGIVDYYLIVGESMLDMLDKYTDITGKPHILPKWGYGLTWVCDERGVRARDVLYEAYEFRRHGIPCDIIGLEPDWMEKHYDCTPQKKWSQERFHIPFWLSPGSPSSFPGALNNMGFKMSLWLCCSGWDFSEYEEFKLQHGKDVKKDMNEIKTSKSVFTRDKSSGDIILDTILGDKKIDTIIKQKEKGVEPWFDHLKKFVDDGASMFKLDGAGQVTLKIQSERIWANGMDDYEMINLYPLLYSKQMHLGYKEYTGKRAMIFTAGGYAGIQRYSASWAGDTGGETGPLVSLLNHGLSGHSNVCTDMHVHSEAGIHFGFFQSLSQVLGWQMYTQPWFLGDKRASMFKDYATLRYRLIPYIYTMAHLASEKAVPVMRAMSLIYPKDPKCDDYLHQYMFGDAFLVSAFQKTVYLPEGEWIDYWTGEKWQGEQEIEAEFPKDKGGPLFVKSGSIIPTQEVKNSIGTETPENIVWEIFPKGDSKFTLYEDDGESYKYLDGEVAKTVVECSENKNNIKITTHSRIGQYNNMPEKRTHSFKIHYPNRKMFLKNENISWHYDAELEILTIDNILEDTNEITLLISLQ